MPAIRDWSYNYISTAATTIICDAPETLAGDLMVAEITCKTAPNTVTTPAAVGVGFDKVFSYGIPIVTKTVYAKASSGVTMSTADGASNVAAGAPSAGTTVPAKIPFGAAEDGTGSYFGPAAPTQNVETLMMKIYGDTYTAAVDLSAIAFSFGFRCYNTTDTCILRLYSHDPAGAANNKTLVATSTVKTPGVITQAQVSWIAANFTLNGTGRIPANNMLLAELSMTRVGATTTAPRFYFGITGVTTSMNLTYTATGIAAGYTDLTTAAGESLVTGDVFPTSALTTVLNDAFYIGAASTFTTANFVCSTAGAGGTSASTWEYWNGSAWVTLTTTTDTTTSWRLATGNQSIVFTAPAGWATTAVNGSTLYWVRSRVSTAGTFTTKPLLSAVFNGALYSWTQLYNVVNTTSPAQVVFYRYARAVEDATFTFGLTSSICSMAIIAIKDVHPTAPFNNGTGYATATNAALKANMPTRTTTVNNCLNLHFVSTSVATIPSIIEGPVTMLYGKDGGTCSDGCGWSFQAVAGTTPTVGMSRVAASADVLGTISVAPPAGGATVIPTYCAADLSTYLDPIQGVTAYNTNTAFAATATTYFGTSLNGKTLANGTAAAVADSGLNSYHSMGDCASGTTKGTWSGCTLVFATANKPNVTGKNLLIHTKPTLAVDLQTTVGIGGTGVCGVALGLCSTANSAYKVFHVSGGGTPWAANYQPVVINESYAGAGLIQNTGTLTASSILTLGFFVSGFLTAANWLFGSAWLLDTTTICGGNISFPVTPSGVAVAASDGHERLSIVRQGTNQILIFQPIQLGNGGTNPLYLNFSNSAVEFPKQYDQASKTTNYCAPDNVCGLIYYAGAADTIIHSNAVISSESKYKWGVHASFNTACVPDFSGLSVIGAGTVSLKAGVTFDGITFQGASEIPAVGATISNCIFKATTGAYALTVATTAEMATISYCQFINNAANYAIRLSNATAGTYSFSGITFSGTRSANKDLYIAATTGTVTINITNGGTTPSYTSAGATVVINNAKTLTITLKNSLGVAVSGVRVSIRKASDNSEIYTASSDVNGVITTTYAYVSDTPIKVIVRKSSTGTTRYLPIAANGTITTNGYDTEFTLVQDTIAAA